MKTVEQVAQLLSVTPNAEQLIELAGRTCYKSEENITEDSAGAFVKKIVESGHDSVLEHASATVRMITNRGMTHELVRHRLASYSQESTRYCNYGSDKFGGIRVMIPLFIHGASVNEYIQLAQMAENVYMRALDRGESAQNARDCLPIGLKTEIVTTMNFRQWRHVLKLRAINKRAHPRIRLLTKSVLDLLVEEAPNVFGDILGIWLAQEMGSATDGQEADIEETATGLPEADGGTGGDDKDDSIDGGTFGGADAEADPPAESAGSQGAERVVSAEPVAPPPPDGGAEGEGETEGDGETAGG